MDTVAETDGNGNIGDEINQFPTVIAQEEIPCNEPPTGTEEEDGSHGHVHPNLDESKVKQTGMGEVIP
jgi:hypothetical protein